MKPYVVTYYGEIKIRVDAHNEEEALELAENKVNKRNKDFDYVNFRTEVELDDEI